MVGFEKRFHPFWMESFFCLKQNGDNDMERGKKRSVLIVSLYSMTNVINIVYYYSVIKIVNSNVGNEEAKNKRDRRYFTRYIVNFKSKYRDYLRSKGGRHFKR